MPDVTSVKLGLFQTSVADRDDCGEYDLDELASVFVGASGTLRPASLSTGRKVSLSYTHGRLSLKFYVVKESSWYSRPSNSPCASRAARPATVTTPFAPSAWAARVDGLHGFSTYEKRHV